MPRKKHNSKKESNNTKIKDNELDESDYDEISISNDPDIDWVDTDDLNIESDNSDNADDNCIYNTVHKYRDNKSSILTLDNESVDSDTDDDKDNTTLNTDIYVKPEDRCSGNILTKYEVVRILSERTSQLSYGAKPMLNGVNGLPARMIAQLELESKMIPLKVVRPLPNGMKEIWSIDELILKDIHIVYGFKGGKVNKNSVLSRTSTSTISDTLY